MVDATSGMYPVVWIILQACTLVYERMFDYIMQVPLS